MSKDFLGIIINNNSRIFKLMKKVFSFFRKYLHFIFPIIDDTSYPVELKTKIKPSKGRVLFCYLEEPLRWKPNNPFFSGHSNTLSSRDAAKVFQDLGFDVDAINYADSTFLPIKEYDVIFDICYNINRLSPYLKPNIKKILFFTGSEPYYQNNAELARIIDLKKRRGSNYQPKRMVIDPESAANSIKLADHIILIGNKHTKSTFPKEYQDKISLINVTGSLLKSSIREHSDLVPVEREFLWFMGGGAVHKGLDLLLEVFARNPDLILNVVGPVDSEPDFIEIYKHELFELDNIHYHGFINPDSEKFKNILKPIFCFISPSCSESMSTAAITCLQIGLFPILSKDTGIDLPDDCGTDLPKDCGLFLENCEIDEIEASIRKVYNLSDDEIRSTIIRTQSYGLTSFNQQKFYQDLLNLVQNICHDILTQ